MKSSPMTSLDPRKLDTLILARLSSRAKNRPSASKVQGSLRPYLEHAYTPAEQRALIEEAVERMRRSEHIEPGALALTDAGRARLRSDLGTDRDLEWKEIKDRVLVMLGLGMSRSDRARKRIATPEGLRGCIIKQRHDLDTRDAAPTLNQAVDALVWRALGVETSEALTINKVRAHVLTHLLGLERRLSRQKLEQMLAAQAVQSGRTDASSLRTGAVRRWAFTPGAAEPEATAAAEAAPEIEPDAPTTFDLRLFADAVNRTAREVEEGRFGERRVFISALWRRMQSLPACAGMREKDFKSHLVEANRQDLVRLHRADLVAAMPAEEVAGSQTHHLNAVFHFVEAPPWSTES